VVDSRTGNGRHVVGLGVGILIFTPLSIKQYPSGGQLSYMKMSVIITIAFKRYLSYKHEWTLENCYIDYFMYCACRSFPGGGRNAKETQ
jgi:hypothetical protein